MPGPGKTSATFCFVPEALEAKLATAFAVVTVAVELVSATELVRTAVVVAGAPLVDPAQAASSGLSKPSKTRRRLFSGESAAPRKTRCAAEDGVSCMQPPRTATAAAATDGGGSGRRVPSGTAVPTSFAATAVAVLIALIYTVLFPNLALSHNIGLMPATLRSVIAATDIA
ncbi:MAG TPA: hypothetical protein VIU62_17730 [Chloroflexota bacterium]